MKVGDAEESRRLGGIATGVTQAQFRAWTADLVFAKSSFLRTISRQLFALPWLH